MDVVVLLAPATLAGFLHQLAAVVGLVSAQIIGWVLVTAGADKGVRLERFTTEIGALPMVQYIRADARWPAAALFVAGETSLGVAALLGLGAPQIFLVIAAVMATLTAVLLFRRPPLSVSAGCGCGGLVESLGSGRAHLAVNGLLAATALVLGLGSSAPGAGLSQPTALVVGGGVAFVIAFAQLVAAYRSVRARRQTIDQARGVA
jgi:hypothetical protein